MTPRADNHSEKFLRELRLFIEELCCNLCRFVGAGDHPFAPEDVQITQECRLGATDAFADIRVQVKGNAPYFIEVKHGYAPGRVIHSLARKFGPGSDLGGATRIK